MRLAVSMMCSAVFQDPQCIVTTERVLKSLDTRLSNIWKAAADGKGRIIHCRLDHEVGNEPLENVRVLFKFDTACSMSRAFVNYQEITLDKDSNVVKIGGIDAGSIKTIEIWTEAKDVKITRAVLNYTGHAQDIDHDSICTSCVIRTLRYINVGLAVAWWLLMPTTFLVALVWLVWRGGRALSLARTNHKAP